MKLFCLPYAGGGAAIYRAWGPSLSGIADVVALELPGHGRKLAHKPIHQWSPLLDHLLDEMAPVADEPLALFGHSMGALLAYELACALRRRHGIDARWLGVSACVAPGRRVLSGAWMERDEQDLIDEVRRLSGTPDEVLQSRELLDMVLPSLRADFHLCGTYRDHGHPPLATELSVFSGDADEATRTPEDVAAWSLRTGARSRLHRLEAGHFFIHDKSLELMSLVRTELELAQASHEARPARLRPRAEELAR